MEFAIPPLGSSAKPRSLYEFAQWTSVKVDVPVTAELLITWMFYVRHSTSLVLKICA